MPCLLPSFVCIRNYSLLHKHTGANENNCQGGLFLSYSRLKLQVLLMETFGDVFFFNFMNLNTFYSYDIYIRYFVLGITCGIRIF